MIASCFMSWCLLHRFFFLQVLENDSGDSPKAEAVLLPTPSAPTNTRQRISRPSSNLSTGRSAKPTVHDSKVRRGWNRRTCVCQIHRCHSALKLDAVFWQNVCQLLQQLLAKDPSEFGNSTNVSQRSGVQNIAGPREQPYATDGWIQRQWKSSVEIGCTVSAGRDFFEVLPRWTAHLIRAIHWPAKEWSFLPASRHHSFPAPSPGSHTIPNPTPVEMTDQ